MSQVDPTNNPDPLKSQNPQGEQPVPPPKKKKRRLWLKVLAGLVVLLIVIVLLIPTIAGLSVVRGIVVGRVNDNLNGHNEIDDWSLGWTGGIHVQGVRIFDDAGTKIASIDKMATELSLIDAIRGKYNLGKTSVEGLDFLLKVDAD